MRIVEGLYRYVVCDELGIAAAHSPETGRLLFFTVDARGLFRSITVPR